MERTTAKVFLVMLISILCVIGGGLSAVLAASLSIQGNNTVSENTQSQYTAYLNGEKVNVSWSVSSTQYASYRFDHRNPYRLLRLAAIKP